MDKKIEEYVTLFKLKDIFSLNAIAQLQLLSLKSGDVLVNSGDEVSHLYIMVSGKLKVFTTLPNGRSMLLRFMTPLSLLGDIELIDYEQAKVQVECITDSECLILPHRIIRDYEMERPLFLHYLLQQICSKMNTNFQSATLNILTNVEHRFASYLLSMSGDNSHPSYRKDELETSSLTEIAEMLGTSYRHLNRVVKKFTDEGLIVRDKKKIMLKNVDGLKERCAESQIAHRNSR